MATPHVVGVVALHLQTGPGASPATVAGSILGDATTGRVSGAGRRSPNRLSCSAYLWGRRPYGLGMESRSLVDNPALLLVSLATYVVVLALVLYVYVRIIRKAGYSGWWALTSLVPVLNLVMVLVFAFADWPVEKRARAAGGGLVGPGAR